MKRLLLLLFIFISYYNVHAQTQQPSGPTPAQTLRLARATYEQGRLHEVPAQLNEGVLAQMTKQEKVSAYTLLCLSYIYLEEAEKADENMLKLIETDHYFQINPAVDPAEFVALYKTFRTDPIYRIGAKIGVNATRPNVSETASAVEFGGDSGYKYLIGFQFGASADLPLYFISRRLTLHGDLMYQQKKYQMTLITNRGVSKEGETLKNEFTGEESQNWLSLPVTVEYELFNKKFKPYVALGAGVDFLLGSEITGVMQRDDQAAIEPQSFEPERNKINISAIAAAGVKLPLAGGFIVMEVRYTHGLTNITSKETAFSNEAFALNLGYADSIFKLSSLSVTGSYIINIFNPKKLKRK